MAKLTWYTFLSLFLLVSTSIQLLGEGTKELMDGNSASNHRAFILIANGNVGGNMRDPFALYNGGADYRLNIHIEDHVNEKIYFGVGEATSGGAVTMRIHAPDGTPVYTGTTPTNNTQPGFIETYEQAFAGPSYLDPAGYDAIVVDPSVNGDYFITFQVGNGQSRSYEKIDISVINTTTNTYKPGRVYSKAWQLNTNEPSAHGFYGYLFVYSQDSIVTRFNPNGFDGRWFTVSCNSSGCYPIGPSMPATQARKSTEGWHNYPEYKIFLNDPDIQVYPSGIIGQVVIPPPPQSAVTVDAHCDGGTIDFTFEVTSSGTVTIMLDLSSMGTGYISREIIEQVNIGQNTITWDGYDGSNPPQLVPSGSTFPFTLTYVKGMTHLPLWDVEENEFGFYVNLVRPASVAEPAFYWDDTELTPPMPPGPVTSPPNGCLSSVNPCHIWEGGDPGDGRTINTWWYVSNTTTVPVTIIKKQYPGNIGPIQGPSQICQGGNAQFIAQFDENAQQYRWVWPGGVDTTNNQFNILNFPMSTTPGPTQVEVHGINEECGNGPSSFLNITVMEVPEVTTTPLQKTICSGTGTAIPLTSSVSGSTFGWRASSTSPNLSGYFNGLGTTTINQLINNSGTTTDTVVYRIAATANGCPGDSVTYKVAVHPVPDLSNNPKTQSQCNNNNTLLELTSNIAGALFTWTSTSSSPLVTGNSDGTTPTDSIKDILSSSSYDPETVTYHITPQANGCNGPVTDYSVTVFPSPDLENDPPHLQICNGQSTGINLTSHVQGTTFTWTCTQTSGNVTGWSANPGPGTTTLDQTLGITGIIKDSVLYHLTPRANGCDGPDTIYTVVVNPVPELTVFPLEDSICSHQTTNIQLSATCQGTSFEWTSIQGVGSITGNTDGTGDLIADQLVNPSNTPGNIIYHITPSTSSCVGLETDYIMWVKPLPHLTNQPKEASICSGTSPNIPLTSDVTNTWFTWTASGSSGNITGYADQATASTLLDQTLTNSGFDWESATYTMTPFAANCQGPDSNYIVTVYPVPDMANDPPETAICSGEATGITLSSHVTGTLFTWSASGSSASITGFSDQPTPTDLLDQTLSNTGYNIETVTYTITPNANGCDGLDTNFVVTVYPVPDLSTIPLTKEICNNNATNISLTSNVLGTLFTWTCTPSSGNVTGYSDNTTTPSDLINQNLINTGNDPETVTYTITPQANGCFGIPVDYVVTVIPSPYLTNNPLSKEQCDNVSTALTLTSNVAGTQFTWTADGSSGNITGYANSAAPGTLIDQTLVNSGFDTETVTYHITPLSSGCPGSVTDFTVSVFPVPDVYFSPTAETVCEGIASNILIESHVTGAAFSWIATASSPNLSGYADGSGDLIAQIVDNSGATIETVTYQVTPEANGCPPGTTQPVILTVNPRPEVTATPSRQVICNGASTSLNLSGDVSGSAFAWRAFSNSPDITGYTDGNGALIAQTLFNSAYATDSVTYRIAGTANGCLGDSTDVQAIVYPVADVVFLPDADTICSGFTTTLSISSNVSGTSYTWIATGSSPDVSGYSNGSGDLIQQTLYNSGYMLPDVTYSVTPTANGCIGTTNAAIVRVNPPPAVSFTVCFDTITTTDAQPIRLRGEVPAGGQFTGTGVTGSTFYPAIAGPGTHEITYTYTNEFGCLDSAKRTIFSFQPSAFNCGDTLIDPRDSVRYPTVEINGQCWMAANLNYGNQIASSMPQRDNCIPEKYCYNDNPALCALSSALYQWDEVMQYTTETATQGFCPPGWHIPRETEWSTLFSNYISSGFAGNALKHTGYSGFNALLTGIRFQNMVLKYPQTDPILRSILFWSSSYHAPGKAWAHGMNEVAADDEYTPSVSFYPAFVSNAFAIRCIKD